MPSEIEDRIGATIERLKDVANSGFSLALHVRYAAPAFLLQSYPKEWIEIYSREGMVLRDPTLLWAMTHTGWKRWSDMMGTSHSDIMRRAADFGIRYGAAYVTKAHGSRSMAFVSRHDRELDAHDRQLVERDFDELHLLTLGVKNLSPDVSRQLRAISVHANHR